MTWRREGYTFPNARLSPEANATQGRALHHYLRFNFKVALVSDEKQEFLVSAVMDVQGGYAVRDAEHLGTAGILRDEAGL